MIIPLNPAELSLGQTLALAWIVGLAIPAGALASSSLVLRSACLRMELDSFVSYFGGGALLAAIALVLIPRGIEDASVLMVAMAFGAGGLAFWLFSACARRTRHSAGLFVGMILDFVPEAILLGVLAVQGSPIVFLLAGLILLQNMPEGFAAYHEMEGRISRPRLLTLFLLASLTGPAGAFLGILWLSSSEWALAVILLFCSGGILYLIFEDIAPKAHSKYRSSPALGAICGFLLGLLGTMLIH